MLSAFPPVSSTLPVFFIAICSSISFAMFKEFAQYSSVIKVMTCCSSRFGSMAPSTFVSRARVFCMANGKIRRLHLSNNEIWVGAASTGELGIAVGMLESIASESHPTRKISSTSAADVDDIGEIGFSCAVS
jgi:hypothetical protein